MLFLSVLIPQQASLSTSNVSSSLVKDIHDAKEAPKIEPRRKSKMASSNTVGFTNLKQGSGYRSSFSGKGLYLLWNLTLFTLSNQLFVYFFTVATVFGGTSMVGRGVTNRLGKTGTQMIIPYRGLTFKKKNLTQSGPENFKKYRPKKLVKSNKSISRKTFLNVFPKN